MGPQCFLHSNAPTPLDTGYGSRSCGPMIRSHRRPEGLPADWRAAQQRQPHRPHAPKANEHPGHDTLDKSSQMHSHATNKAALGKGGLDPEGARLADVHNSFLGLRLGGAGGLSGKLKHCCCLTFRQVRQKLNVPVGKFQRVVVCARLAFVDLPKDSRGVLDCFHFTAKQANPRALWLLIEGEFSPRKNTNRGPRILRRREPSSSCVEVAGDQSVADLRWSRLRSMQTVVAAPQNFSLTA